MTWEHDTFDPAEFVRELEPRVEDRAVGTALLLENERVRVWEIRLEPGRRAPFHRHVHPYLWVCVDGGRVRTRFPDGNMVTYDVEVGITNFSEPSEDAPEIHDLENVGQSLVRFTTVELTSR
jgi:hypothetical protein